MTLDTLGASNCLGSAQAAQTTAPLSTLAEHQADFASVLAQQGNAGAPGSKGGATPTEVAQDLVSMSLVQPVLHQLRATSQAWGPFAPTQYEKTFGQMNDAVTARRLVRASNFPIVGAVATMIQDRADRLSGKETRR